MAKEIQSNLHDVNAVEELQYLLRAGANVNERNIFEETPLLSALRRDVDFKLIEEFLKNGADVHAKDCWGVSPLYCAIARHGKNLRLIKFLLDQGADIQSGKRINDRFLDHTVTHNQSCIKLLIKYKFLKNIHLLGDFNLNTDFKPERDYYQEYKAIVDLDLKPSCYDYLREFLDSCASEAVRMQTVHVGNDLTLVGFVTLNSPAETHGDTTMKDIIEKVFEELSMNDYPIFKNILVSKIGRDCLLNKITEQLNNQHAVNKPLPYRVILFCLAKYLTDEHLLDIVKALY